MTGIYLSFPVPPIHNVNISQPNVLKVRGHFFGGRVQLVFPEDCTSMCRNIKKEECNCMQTFKATGYVLIICLILFGSSFLAGCTEKAPDAGVVTTDAGSVSGLNQDGIRVFLGIPFAAPPTGDLRWKPPAPVTPWVGVKETTTYAASCPEPANANALMPGVPQTPMSEDCLYLNVWTPAHNASEKLPVMIFFYGGAFEKIAGSMPMYNGTPFAKKGVILVTTNYRIGALGFLAHPELANESPVNSSGNYGFLDQIAAMKWVQKNIGAFGGDPTRVTIFGQSAGAEAVWVHLASPQSKGLFSQAIVESGTFWENGAVIDSLYSKSRAEQWGEDYAASLGYTGPDAIVQMRRVPYQDLVNATPWPSATFRMMTTTHFVPTIDGWMIPDSLENLYRLHEENPVPVIIGTNKNEGVTLASGANMTVPEYQAFIRNRFGNTSGAILAKYPANSTAEAQLRLNQIVTDIDFADAARFGAGSLADMNAGTYLYTYSYVLPGQTLGAFHGSELFLLFKVPGVTDPESTKVSDNLIDLWTRFAKTGNPNGGMNVTWPQYTREGGEYLDIGAVPVVKNG